MKRRIGLIGFGTIGKKVYQQIIEENLIEVAFIYDLNIKDEKVVNQFPTAEVLAELDLVVECATAKAVEDYGDIILQSTNFMPFSLTALANEELSCRLIQISQNAKTTLFIPHGAILGLDGIFDGRTIFENIEIATIKNPKSLARNDCDRTVVYEGSTRGICRLMPRNVNVHAALALAGIGMDKTKSLLISDPAITENSHIIKISSSDVAFEIKIKSNPIGAVTGAYTPISAYGSIKRALNLAKKYQIV